MADQEPINLKRVLEKVQSDPTGALLVQSAVQACIIEDQAEALAALRAELVKATGVRADNEAAGEETAGEEAAAAA